MEKTTNILKPIKDNLNIEKNDYACFMLNNNLLD